MSSAPASLVTQGKESACNAGDPGFNPWAGKIPWRREGLPTPVFLGFPAGSDGKESTCNVGDPEFNPCWEDPLENGKATHSSSVLKNSIDCIVHGVAKKSVGPQRVRHD